MAYVNGNNRASRASATRTSTSSSINSTANTNNAAHDQTNNHTTPDLQYLMVKRATIADPSMQAEWAKKRLIWVPHDREGFVAGSIIEDNGDHITVEIIESGQRLKVSMDDCQKMNPPKFDKVSYQGLAHNIGLLSQFKISLG